MRWPTRKPVHEQVILALKKHSAERRPLPGIVNADALETLGTQIVASLRREDYYRAIQRSKISSERASPNSGVFDAERAVAFHMQQANIDEATWLVFLMTHFAKPADTGWLRLQDVYGMLGEGVWDWQTVSKDPHVFAAWLAANWRRIRGKFGNHRKYESLRPDSARNMGRVTADYVRWIGDVGHATFIAKTMARGSNDLFDALYRDMAVTSFGRLAKFDYLMMLSRYSIISMAPTSAFLDGATGPRSGACLLFTGKANCAMSTAALQRLLDELDVDLGVGMAVLEDSLCNWQKSPTEFIHFKG